MRQSHSPIPWAVFTEQLQFPRESWRHLGYSGKHIDSCSHRMENLKREPTNVEYRTVLCGRSWQYSTHRHLWEQSWGIQLVLGVKGKNHGRLPERGILIWDLKDRYEEGREVGLCGVSQRTKLVEPNSNGDVRPTNSGGLLGKEKPRLQVISEGKIH